MLVHIDMNSYFASVEQQANPHLRGRPLGVCAYLHKNGCVIAASIEAKKLGVKVGMSMGEARAKCPEMAFVQNDPPKYRAVTSRVFSILHELTDKVEHYSIDEAFLDLTGWYRDEAEAAWALARAKLRIRREVGEWLGCSVGIAPNKFLAKLASDLEKPNGLVVLNERNLDETLAGLELEDAWGIGKRIRRRLNRLGIFTLLDLKRHPVGNLMRAFGKAGWQWHRRLHGHEADRLDQAGERVPQSVGHSFCVPRRPSSQPSHRPASQGGDYRTVARRARLWRDPASLEPGTTGTSDAGRILGILLRLIERAGRRMRSYGLLARRLDVAVSVVGQTSDTAGLNMYVVPEGLTDAQISGPTFRNRWEAEVPSGCSVDFGEPADDVFTLTRAATRALEETWDGESQVTFLAVTLSGLVPWSDQLSLHLVASVIPNSIRDSKTNDSCTHNPSSPPFILRGGFGSEGKRSASKAVDRIRDRYGEESIVFASMLGLERDYAPDRIGFRKTEGVDVVM